MAKVRTAQLGSKLFIMDGRSPLKYVDLTEDKVVVYDKKTNGGKQAVVYETAYRKRRNGTVYRMVFIEYEDGSGEKFLVPPQLPKTKLAKEGLL